MKKTFGFSFLFAILLLGFGISDSASASTEKSVEDKLAEIDQKYEVGEILSEEDANVIMMFADKVENPTNNSEGIISPLGIFSGTKKYVNSATKNGVTAKITGKCFIDHSNPIKSKYNCDLDGTTNKGKVKTSVSHTAYGFIGNSKVIGKIYSKTHNSTMNKSKASLKISNNYGGVVAYSVTTVKARAESGTTTVEVTDM